MWKNTLSQIGYRWQYIIHWITKVTDTHRKYIVLVAVSRLYVHGLSWLIVKILIPELKRGHQSSSTRGTKLPDDQHNVYLYSWCTVLPCLGGWKWEDPPPATRVPIWTVWCWGLHGCHVRQALLREVRLHPGVQQTWRQVKLCYVLLLTLIKWLTVCNVLCPFMCITT
jgi:hypothetical protein